MSDPVLKRERVGNTATFAVDLGSAPVTTLESLLDAVERLGSKRVELGQLSAA
jgi:hypothetical protein